MKVAAAPALKNRRKRRVLHLDLKKVKLIFVARLATNAPPRSAEVPAKALVVMPGETKSKAERVKPAATRQIGQDALRTATASKRFFFAKSGKGSPCQVTSWIVPTKVMAKTAPQHQIHSGPHESGTETVSTPKIAPEHANEAPKRVFTEPPMDFLTTAP